MPPRSDRLGIRRRREARRARYFDAMAVAARGGVVQRIVERTDLDAFAERLLDAFWDSPECLQLPWLHRKGGANP